MRRKTLATPSPSVIVYSSLSIIFFEKHEPKQQIISAAPAPSQTAFRAFVRQPPHVIQNILHSLDLVLGFNHLCCLGISVLHLYISWLVIPKQLCKTIQKCPKHFKRPSSTLCLKFQAQLCFQWWHFLLRTSIWILTI